MVWNSYCEEKEEELSKNIGRIATAPLGLCISSFFSSSVYID